MMQALQLLPSVEETPGISAIVCTYNEEARIGSLLDQMAAQRGVDGRIEVIVVDGASTDRTVNIVRSYRGPIAVRLVPNARRLQVVGLNEGRRHSRGRYLAFLNAHVDYAEDYLACCLVVMHRTGASNVGGVPRAVGTGTFGKAVAWAMSTPFGVGGSAYRYTTREQTVESVCGGFLERETIDAIGGHDESCIINEDGELNCRLRRAGHAIVVSPEIGMRYHVRRTVRDLSVQYFRYGFWRRRTQILHPGMVPLRVLAPPALLIGLILSFGAAWWTGAPVFYAVPGIYALFLLIAALASWRDTHDLRIALCIPIALATMHASFGVGWIAGLFAHRRRRS